MYDLVDMLTYKLQTISPSTWPVFELTYKLFKHDAIDFLQGRESRFMLALFADSKLGAEMLPSLINFVMFGSEVIKSRSDYKQMLVDIYTTSITNDQLGENDHVNGSKLVESILLILRGSLDEVCSTASCNDSRLDSRSCF